MEDIELFGKTVLIRQEVEIGAGGCREAEQEMRDILCNKELFFVQRVYMSEEPEEDVCKTCLIGVSPGVNSMEIEGIPTQCLKKCSFLHWCLLKLVDMLNDLGRCLMGVFSMYPSIVLAFVAGLLVLLYLHNR